MIDNSNKLRQEKMNRKSFFGLKNKLNEHVYNCKFLIKYMNPVDQNRDDI